MALEQETEAGITRESQ